MCVIRKTELMQRAISGLSVNHEVNLSLRVRRKMKTYIWCFKWLFLLVLNPLHAYGQDYPSKPVYLVVPFAPGGGADILARFIGQGLSMSLGKPVLVDNRSGGGGNIGANYVAKATPDGYTLLVAGIPQAIGMSLYGKLPYDLAADLMPITQAATFANIIVVHPSLPVKSIKELLTLARKKPGELNYGANPGSPNHLGMELMGVKLNHISYRGSGQVLTELLSGQIQLAGLSFPVSLPFVQSGRLRAIAVTSEQRSPVLPNVPTVTEA
jgi:tripartite-type tricarboxylate transporter receptor subunit TctC